MYMFCLAKITLALVNSYSTKYLEDLYVPPRRIRLVENGLYIIKLYSKLAGNVRIIPSLKCFKTYVKTFLRREVGNLFRNIMSV